MSNSDNESKRIAIQGVRHNEVERRRMLRLHYGHNKLSQNEGYLLSDYNILGAIRRPRRDPNEKA